MIAGLTQRGHTFTRARHFSVLAERESVVRIVRLIGSFPP